MLKLNIKSTTAIVSLLLIAGYPLLLLPISTKGEPSSYSYAVYIFVIFYLIILSMIFLAKSFLRKKLNNSYIYIILLYTIYAISSMIFYQADNNNSNNFLIIPIGFLISIYSFYLGSKLVEINNNAKIDILISLLVIYFIVVSIIKYLDYGFTSLIQERHFIFQASLLLFIAFWINDFSKLSEYYKILSNLAIIALLFITGSRSALIGIMLYVFIKIAFSSSNNKNKIMIFIFLLLVSVLMFDLSTIDWDSLYGNRVSGGFFVDDLRYTIRQAYIEYIVNNHLMVFIGSGFNTPSIGITSSGSENFVNIFTPHNSYLYLIQSIGTLGIIIFLFFLKKIIQTKENIAFLSFVLIFSFANDILIFPSYNSQLMNTSIWYLIFGLYANKHASYIS